MPASPNIFIATAQGVTKAAVVAAPCALRGYCAINPNAYAVYIKLFDALSADVTVGTTVPKRVIPIPAAGYMYQEYQGFPITDFTAGLTVAVTKNASITDATALASALDRLEILY